MASDRPSRICFLLLPCLLGGCAGFYDEIFLNADGSGSYRLTVFVKKGAADEDLPALLATVRDRAAKIAATAGFTLKSVDVKRDGPLLVVEVTAGFPSLSVFANPALCVSENAGQWSFVVPREASYRDGRFVAHVLRGSAPPKEHPLRVALQGHEARFTVHLPGEVVEGNGQPMQNSANWGFPLEQLCDAPIQMIAVARPSFPVWPLLLGALVVTGLAVLVPQLFRTRRGAPSV
jgi:hypothetical protein